MAKLFLAEKPSNLSKGRNYTPDVSLSEGNRFRYKDLTFVITTAAGSTVPLSKAIGVDGYIITRIPFHIGYIEDTDGHFHVAINSNVELTDATDVVIVDTPTSATTVDHYILIGYKDLDDAPSSLLDVLQLDTKTVSNKKYLVKLDTISPWVEACDGKFDKAFSGLLCTDDTTHRGTGVPAGQVPVSYGYVNGRKVYKACILGAIATMNDSLRTLCDTITFMGKEDYMFLYISSGGGDTQTASAIITAMSLCPGTIVSIACGPCASAAPVIWSKGHIRLITDNASMMVHSMAVSDPAVKTTSHIVDMGEFTSLVTESFLSQTVGSVGLATREEIKTCVETSKEYYHDVSEVIRRTGAPVITTDRDIWDHILDQEEG